MDLGQGSRLEGAVCFECFKARSFCYTSPHIFSLSPSFSLSLSFSFSLSLSLSYDFCLDWGFPIMIFWEVENG